VYHTLISSQANNTNKLQNYYVQNSNFYWILNISSLKIGRNSKIQISSSRKLLTINKGGKIRLTKIMKLLIPLFMKPLLKRTPTIFTVLLGMNLLPFYGSRHGTFVNKIIIQYSFNYSTDFQTQLILKVHIYIIVCVCVCVLYDTKH
jgi:hypothetical protein